MFGMLGSVSIKAWPSDILRVICDTLLVIYDALRLTHGWGWAIVETTPKTYDLNEKGH